MSEKTIFYNFSEENNCKRLENRVENLKEQLQEINFNISNYESKIEELHVQVTNIDNEIQTKLCQKQELEKEQEKLKKKLGKSVLFKYYLFNYI